MAIQSLITLRIGRTNSRVVIMQPSSFVVVTGAAARQLIASFDSAIKGDRFDTMAALMASVTAPYLA